MGCVIGGMFAGDCVELAIHECGIGAYVAKLRAIPAGPSLRGCLLKGGAGPGCESVFNELCQSWDSLSFAKPGLTLCKRGAMGRFDLARSARITLPRALLKVLAIEKEVIPVD